MQVIKGNKPKEPIDPRTIKEKLWEEFEKQSETVLTLALLYARGYDLGGEDVTKAWTNALRNNQILETAYRRGYEDAITDFENNRRRDFYHKIVYDLKNNDKKGVNKTDGCKGNGKR